MLKSRSVVWLVAVVVLRRCLCWAPASSPRSLGASRVPRLAASGAPKRRRRKRTKEDKEVKLELEEIDQEQKIVAEETAAPQDEEALPELAVEEDDDNDEDLSGDDAAAAMEEQPAAARAGAPLRIQMPSTEEVILSGSLPTPSEGLVDTQADTPMGLPKLAAVAARSADRKKRGKKPATLQKRRQIEDFNVEEYTKAIELDPNADADPTLFKQKTVDLFAISLGEGADTFFGVDSAYLQVGHAMLALVLLLAAFVVEPNFPLTDAPPEYRGAVQQGLAVVYLVNAGLAYLAWQEAHKRGQPKLFWAAKSFLLGGVALNQLRTGTKPPVSGALLPLGGGGETGETGETGEAGETGETPRQTPLQKGGTKKKGNKKKRQQ